MTEPRSITRRQGRAAARLLAAIVDAFYDGDLDGLVTDLSFEIGVGPIDLEDNLDALADEVRPALTHPWKCPRCARPFGPDRAIDAVYCGRACQLAAYTESRRELAG